MIAPDGRRGRVLTAGLASPYAPPVLSPNGRAVLFCADGPQPGLYIVPTHGGPLYQKGACDGDPVLTWSPNGREIAYIGSARGADTGDLFVVDVLTKRGLRLSSQVQDWQGVGAPIYNWRAADELAWSPDSKKIAFAASTATQTININGTDVRKLVQVQIRRSTILTLSWSRDGSRIAFTAGRRYYEP